MSTYIYAPIGGPAGSCFSGGSPVYCNGSSCTGDPHSSVRCSNPLDISAYGDAYIYIDSSCLSINTWYVGESACRSCTGCSSSPYTIVIQVDLYSGANKGGTLFGSVVFAHATSVNYGLQNLATYGSIKKSPSKIYTTPTGSCGGLDCNGDGKPDYCFTGSHVHMEFCSANGVNTSWGCTNQYVAASTWIYYW